jgi:copper resistance protein C
MRRRRLVRSSMVVLLTGLALLFGSAPAWAHSQLETSDPASGTSVAAAPQKVSLTFNEPVQPGFTVITVIGPDGDDYHSGDISEVDDTVSVGVLPLGPAGPYFIGYRVVSADGHPISGSVVFTLTTAGAGSGVAVPLVGGTSPSNGAPSVGGTGGAPVWPWIVGAVVVVAIGAGAALRLGRS